MRRWPLAIALAALAPACGGEEGASARVAAGSEPAVAARAAPRPEHERPLPAFSGNDFEGRRIEVSQLLGRRLLIFFFDPDEPEAEATARAVGPVARLRAKHNFGVLGVATGASTAAARRFIEGHEFDFPVLNDASGAVAGRFGLRAPTALLLVDAEGYVVGALGGARDGETQPALEASLREALRLPGAEPGPAAGTRPALPDFRALPLDGGEPVTSDSLAGRPAVLVFFLHTCPHCHEALRFLKQYLAERPAAQRPALVGVAVAGDAETVRRHLREKQLDFLPVVLDSDRALRNAFGAFVGVPDIVLVDRQGRIAGRVRGWREDRDPPLLRMRLAKLAGEPVPMLLHATGYSGNEFCGVCHETQQSTWELTAHAGAFETLVEHNAERNEECIGCHVVGFGASGGYTVSPPTPTLEDVGCESCHGRGGPHLSPGFVVGHDYQAVCLTCHDTKHSLGFDYAKFLPRVSHAANRALLALDPAERAARLRALGRPGGELLPSQASHVGSQACRACHAAEHETWSEHPHARAFARLEAAGKAGDAQCLPCHTTGYGRPGGFAPGARPAAHPGLLGVGCEACHGPGGDHVAPGARRRGTILSLGDKCDSCVILEICGSCHDDANDPGFEFEVLDKIRAQRHGTIEPGTGRPLPSEAQGELRGGALLATFERALALVDARAAAGGGG